jgi:predicted nucleotidyltransferase
MDPDATRNLVCPGVYRFAKRLHDQLGAEHVYLFGSRARGQQRQDSDYDFIIVSRQFEGVHRRRRALGLRQIFYEVAGPAPIDLICLTPEEFELARSRITMVASVLPEAIDLLAPEQPAA